MYADTHNNNIKYVTFPDITKQIFHGSRTGIQGKIKPDFEQSRNACDFGRGFYTYLNREPAMELICDENAPNPIIYTATLRMNGLKGVYLDGVPWALLIAYHRGYLDACYDKIANLIKNQDIIIAPALDERIALVLNDFYFGRIPDTVLLTCMNATRLETQYVLKTQQACDQLEQYNSNPLTSEDLTNIRNNTVKQINEEIERLAQIKLEHRHDDGLYFSEIMDETGQEHRQEGGLYFNEIMKLSVY